MSIGPAGVASGLRQSLWIPGPMPGMNQMIAAAKGCGGRGVLYAQMKREWTDKVAWLAKAQKMKPVPRCRVICAWTERKRNRDPDNFIAGIKLIADGLVLAGVIPGDGWGVITGFSHTWTSGDRPGVLVVLEESVL